MGLLLQFWLLLIAVLIRMFFRYLSVFTLFFLQFCRCSFPSGVFTVDNLWNTTERRIKRLMDEDILGEPISEEESEQSKIVSDEFDPDTDLYEDDILVPEEEMTLSDNRAATPEYYKKWPKEQEQVVVPYKISQYFDGDERKIIAKGMWRFHEETCIRFRDYNPSTDTNFLHIFPGDGCWSYVGKQWGQLTEQPLSLGYGCKRTGTVIHELMHAVGFHHEHNRPDRDDYVTIHEHNVQEDDKYNFDKEEDAKTFGSKYDFCSVMHYSSKAFSKYRREHTITAKVNAECSKNFGRKGDFSDTDVRELNSFYQCKGYKQVDTQCKDKYETEWCSRWASWGYCTEQYQVWMKENCQKTCNHC